MELIKWNKARQAIIEAKSIDEVKEIRDQAQAMKAYVKQIGESLEVQNNICEIKLRAERRMGEMIQENPEIRRGGSKSHNVTLNDIGVSKMQSSRYQSIADLPEKTFENTIEEIKETGKELTESFMLKTAKIIERETKIQEQKEAIEKGDIQLPKGKYEVIVVDPPWDYGTKYDPETRRVANPYPEMSLEEIENIILPTSKNCVLWLWTTHKFMKNSFKLLDSWGFEDKAILTWVKNKMGMGRWLRSKSEFCIMAVKGKPIIRLTNQTTVLMADNGKHSEKPQEFYKMVEKLCIGRKLDYFARKKRKGWDVYGDEILQ